MSEKQDLCARGARERVSMSMVEQAKMGWDLEWFRDGGSLQTDWIIHEDESLAFYAAIDLALKKPLVRGFLVLLGKGGTSTLIMTEEARTLSTCATDLKEQVQNILEASRS
jgi:hypothetical protein